MKTAFSEIPRLRLANQRIAAGKLAQPADVAAWLTAIQAQDYTGALWSVGLRLKEGAEPAVERAIAEKKIVRTWPMRGTLHFVAAEDVHWMLSLLAPRIVSGSAARRRNLELDDATVMRSHSALEKALQGGASLTRAEVNTVLEKAGIDPRGQRSYHLLQRAALDRLICFGSPRGKQQTFVLLDEWAPQVKTLERDAALAELAGRYFRSRGPAALHDFVWWSGLRVSEARAGMEAVKPQFIQEAIDGVSCWIPPITPTRAVEAPTVHLMSGFDEYLLAYRDRRAVLDPQYAGRLVPGGNGMFKSFFLVNGVVAGLWKRTLRKDRVLVEAQPFTALSADESQAFAAAADQYGAFLGLPAASA